jgi:hypothetical protein
MLNLSWLLLSLNSVETSFFILHNAHVDDRELVLPELRRKDIGNSAVKDINERWNLLYRQLLNERTNY